MSRRSRLDHLDMLRGLAAVLVLAGHLRHFMFDEFAALAGPSLLTKLFYLVTSLQHQAVIIFFALSGFLVGGKAFDDLAKGSFSWQRYMLRRITRLWIVMIPALVLTLVFDAFAGGHAVAEAQTGAGVFLGNLLFLQNIFVPVLGSNAPLWSLANEFWYYVLGPVLIALAIGRGSMMKRGIALATLLIVGSTFPGSVLAGGVIWLSGAFAAWASRIRKEEAWLRAPLVRLTALVALCSALGGSKFLFLDAAATPLGTVTDSDVVLGAIVALTLPVLALLPPPTVAYTHMARATSEISYTLYVTHYPFLIVLLTTGLHYTKSAPTIGGLILYIGLLERFPFRLARSLRLRNSLRIRVG